MKKHQETALIAKLFDKEGILKGMSTMTRGNAEKKMQVLQTGVRPAVDLAIIGSGAL